jgi:hypothetical protein
MVACSVSDESSDDPNINDALDRVEIKENLMSEGDMQLRDELNKELAKQGYHLRLALVRVTREERISDFVEPVHEWFDELQRAMAFVDERMQRWQQEHFP